MSKTDLKARPMFHHTRDAIEAHLTIVFTALKSRMPDLRPVQVGHQTCATQDVRRQPRTQQSVSHQVTDQRSRVQKLPIHLLHTLAEPIFPVQADRTGRRADNSAVC